MPRFLLIWVGREGFLVNVELRNGKTHCQKYTPDFLSKSLSYAQKMTDQTLLVRTDGGNDSADNVNIYLDAGADFIAKRNPRQESKEDWLAYERGPCEGGELTI